MCFNSKCNEFSQAFRSNNYGIHSVCRGITKRSLAQIGV
uniref:Uncharacterized protein n=1 Tax=Anguilla anguilla TaxID=7936 RepID=A0A0E9PNB0_ANGAN